MKNITREPRYDNLLFLNGFYENKDYWKIYNFSLDNHNFQYKESLLLCQLTFKYEKIL